MSGRLVFREEERVSATESATERGETQCAARAGRGKRRQRQSHTPAQGKRQSSYELFDLTKDDSNDDNDKDDEGVIASDADADVEGSEGKKRRRLAVQQTIVLVDDSDGERERVLAFSSAAAAANNNNNNSTSAAAAIASTSTSTDNNNNVDTNANNNDNNDNNKSEKKKKNKKNKNKNKDKAQQEAEVLTQIHTQAEAEKEKRIVSLLGSDDERTSDKESEIERETLVENVLRLSERESESAAHAHTDTHTLSDTLSSSVSPWLSRFLEKKHDRLDCELEDIEPSSDEYLRLFHEDYVQREKEKQRETEFHLPPFISDDEEEEEEREGEEEESSEQANAFAGDEEEKETENLVTVNIFNLPYKFDEKEMKKWLTDMGFTVRSVSLGSAEKKKEKGGLPLGAGSATLLLTETQRVERVIDAITGADCRGRAVRAEKPSSFGDAAKRRISFGGASALRYFVTDISCKCTLCGQVGHRTQECMNEPLPVPCHQCAGTDHDAGQCPNILCFRCGKFGHHSRDCKGGSRARPIVCVQCGALDHDVLRCRERGGECVSRYESQVAGPYVQCITCGEKGHVMCAHMPWDRKRKDKNSGPEPVYCPNCGQEGHHVDFPPHHSEPYNASRYCRAPRCEAYFRFPQLRDVENILSPDNDALFNNLIRGPNDSSLFPSLSIPAPPRNNHSRFSNSDYGYDRSRERDRERDRDRSNYARDRGAPAGRSVSYVEYRERGGGGRGYTEYDDRDRERDRGGRKRSYEEHARPPPPPPLHPPAPPLAIPHYPSSSHHNNSSSNYNNGRHVESSGYSNRGQSNNYGYNDQQVHKRSRFGGGEDHRYGEPYRRR